MQKLILPINACKLTASWQTEAYFKENGFRHYGADLICSSLIKDRKIWASGNGVVIDVGFDQSCGNIIIIKYPDVINHKTGKSADIILRYFHLQKISIAKGQKVTTDTVLGEYGGTGQYGGGTFCKHLHIEADYDTSHPKYTPTLKNGTWLVGEKQSGTALKNMLNSMVNPMELFHAKISKPDEQKYITANDCYIRIEDSYIPQIS